MKYIVGEFVQHRILQDEDSAANEERAMMVLRPVTVEAPERCLVFQSLGLSCIVGWRSVFEGCRGSISEQEPQSRATPQSTILQTFCSNLCVFLHRYCSGLPSWCGGYGIRVQVCKYAFPHNEFLSLRMLWASRLHIHM